MNHTVALLTTADLSAYLNVPAPTIHQWAYLGTGPKFIKVGHQRRYRPEDVEQWLDERTRTASTRGTS